MRLSGDIYNSKLQSVLVGVYVTFLHTCYVFNDDIDDHTDDDDEHNDEDQNCQNSDNFQARRSRFCMVINLHNNQRMILTLLMIMMMILMMMMKMMNIMMKIKIAITRKFFKLGGPNFAWYKT